MPTLRIDLEYCYGIKKLRADFDFRSGAAYAIYAPNGSMKSSLAQTFKDAADGVESCDRVFPDRETRRVLSDANGDPVPPESILVLPPYDEVFGHNEKTSTLLVDRKLGKEYEELHTGVNRAAQALVSALKKQSGLKSGIEEEVALTFTKDPGAFHKALIRIREEVREQDHTALAGVDYRILFDEKALAFLRSKDVQDAVAEYIGLYNQLLEDSTYFRKGVFDYHNAATIAKALASNGFFKARHTVTLNASENREVSNETELAELIDEEKDAILNDAELRKRFAKVEKLITANVSLRGLQQYLADNEFLLARLNNIDQLKEDVWKSYFKAHEGLYEAAIEAYQVAQQRRGEIEQAAAAQHTQWEDVIQIFNSRFFVPFELVARNKTSVVLGAEGMLELGFTFVDGEERAPVERKELMRVLSTGEKKALYILNVLFEIEVRKRNGQDTILIVDDIADSFDYKNKYAIIQYLKDIADEDGFRQILLTHNFDFFRTVESRFVSYNQCLTASNGKSGLVLEKAQGIRNIFTKDWKKHLFDDGLKRMAAIPFVRNIVEYTRGEEDDTYQTLTSLVHWKEGSADVTQADLDKIFHDVLPDVGGTWDRPEELVIDAISDEVDVCLREERGANLEHKIVLAIGIRLAAERFMIDLIQDPEFVAELKWNQTQKLLKRVKEMEGVAPETVAALDMVVLMTPENIHLNSFMYEPILDMSDEHLRRLYLTVKSLTTPA